MEELLEKAKQMFPIGTIFNNSNVIDINIRDRTTIGIPYIQGDKISVKVITNVTKYLYKNGKWANIISLPTIKEPDYEVY